MNKTCFCSYERSYGMFGDQSYRTECRCNNSSYSPSAKASAPKNRNSVQLLTAKLAKRGASGTLRHVTPVIVRQPSLIERLTATAKRIVAAAKRIVAAAKYAVLHVSTGKLFSLIAVLAVASWIWG